MTIDDQVGHGWAYFGKSKNDPSSAYRYVLGRWLDRSANVAARRVLFCMLNPSTADARILDPTVRRCVQFSLSWGFGTMVVVNLFAFRSTDPGALAKSADPVGVENDSMIKCEAEEADLVVAAWGSHPIAVERSKRVLSLLGKSVMCLGTTIAGQPKHPLYIRGDQPLIPFAGH